MTLEKAFSSGVQGAQKALQNSQQASLKTDDEDPRNVLHNPYVDIILLSSKNGFMFTRKEYSEIGRHARNPRYPNLNPDQVRDKLWEALRAEIPSQINNYKSDNNNIGDRLVVNQIDNSIVVQIHDFDNTSIEQLAYLINALVYLYKNGKFIQELILYSQIKGVYDTLFSRHSFLEQIQLTIRDKEKIKEEKHLIPTNNLDQNSPCLTFSDYTNADNYQACRTELRAKIRISIPNIGELITQKDNTFLDDFSDFTHHKHIENKYERDPQIIKELNHLKNKGFLLEKRLEQIYLKLIEEFRQNLIQINIEYNALLPRLMPNILETNPELLKRIEQHNTEFEALLADENLANPHDVESALAKYHNLFFTGAEMIATLKAMPTTYQLNDNVCPVEQTPFTWPYCSLNDDKNESLIANSSFFSTSNANQPPSNHAFTVTSTFLLVYVGYSILQPSLNRVKNYLSSRNEMPTEKNDNVGVTYNPTSGEQRIKQHTTTASTLYSYLRHSMQWLVGDKSKPATAVSDNSVRDIPQTPLSPSLRS